MAWVLICILLQLGCSNEDDSKEILSRFDNGNPKQIVFYSKNLLPDKIIVREVNYFEEGNIESEINYKKGKKHGLSRSWHKNGALKNSIVFEQDIPADTMKIWYENGNLKDLHFFTASGKLKKLESFHENGQKSFYMVFDEPEETWYEWYDNGQMRSKNPNANGTVKEWYSDGNLLLEGEVVEGKETGVWLYWNIQGELTKKVMYEGGMAIDSVVLNQNITKNLR